VPSASELIVPLRGALVPVPAANQVGVCAICRSSAGPGYDTCFKCGQAAWLQPPDVVPITLSVDGGLIPGTCGNIRTAGNLTRAGWRSA
jgi:hypothetical protein